MRAWLAIFQIEKLVLEFRQPAAHLTQAILSPNQGVCEAVKAKTENGIRAKWKRRRLPYFRIPAIPNHNQIDQNNDCSHKKVGQVVNPHKKKRKQSNHDRPCKIQDAKKADKRSKIAVHAEALELNESRQYSERRAVCPAQGISLPQSCGAARASRLPWRRGFLWSGALRAPSGAPFHRTVRLIVARPATRGLASFGRTITCGDRL